MTSPYGRMPMVCSLKTPLRCGGRARGRCPEGWAFGGTEGRSLPRSGGSSNHRAVAAFPDCSPTDERGGGESRGRGQTRQHAQGISWITSGYPRLGEASPSKASIAHHSITSSEQVLKSETGPRDLRPPTNFRQHQPGHRAGPHLSRFSAPCSAARLIPPMSADSSCRLVERSASLTHGYPRWLPLGENG
jgi:hypothetical protein